MPVNNRIADFQPEIAEWRQWIHQHPGLDYDVQETAGLVVEKLKAFGVDEIVEHIGRSGVVALIKGRKTNSGKVIGLRADMDALPIAEKTDRPYKSKYEGKMHACGHDGHTAMLLGAAKYLAETRNFDGTVALIFQPAEEGGGGGKAMCDEGMMSRFDIQEVYGLHNLPGLPVGEFAIRSGALMASTDEFRIKVKGQAGHAALPHQSRDPIVAGAYIVQALQMIIARNIDPLESGVISITEFHSGNSHNVIPHTADLRGTIRALSIPIRDKIIERMQIIIDGVAASHEVIADFKVFNGYPATINHKEQTHFAADVAREIAGDARVNDDTPAIMGGEDFSYMLLERPGAFIFMGNGNSAGLHHEEYDFNDEAITSGVSYWAKIVEKSMPL